MIKAQDLFPDIFDDLPDQEMVYRPLPPDVSWLATGVQPEGDDEAVQVRRAFVLISDAEKRRSVEKILTDLGFKTDSGRALKNPHDELMRIKNCLVIADVDDVIPTIHNHMLKLPMARRRTVYYVLVGPRLRTLFGLEALSLSANLVVNYNELGKLEPILRKGFREYEALYAPFLEELQGNVPGFIG